MNLDLKNLPDNPTILKQVISKLAGNYKNKLVDKDTEIVHITNRLSNTEFKLSNTEFKLKDTENKLKEEKLRSDWLKAKADTLIQQLYGKKSEKIKRGEDGQLFLFNEAELNSDLFNVKKQKKTRVKSYIRHKRGKRKFPDYLDEEIIEHDLSSKEKKCPCCGKKRKCIGSDDTKKLKYIPAQIKIIIDRVYKYGPCNCGDFFRNEYPEIISAKKPPVLIPGSMADSSLLAQVITAKYADGLPLYRQEQIFQRHGIEFSRATMSNWALVSAEKCKPIIDLFEKDIRSGPIINMDETRVQVLKESGKSPSSNSYMWIRVGCTAEHKKIVLFKYARTRAGKIANELLSGFNGYLQTDGYQGYNMAVKENDLIHVGCLAHIRRKFFLISELAKKNNIKIESAEEALKFIADIYIIEKRIRKKNLSADKFVLMRKKKIKPILDKFYNWLTIKHKSVPPKSSMGRAVNYALHEWSKFTNFLDSVFLTPDNNIAENTIRPFVIGRKNWLFSITPRGANSSAVLYSLIETAKANGLEPFKYLHYLFKKLPLVKNEEEIRKLLPYNLSSDTIIKNIDMG